MAKFQYITGGQEYRLIKSRTKESITIMDTCPGILHIHLSEQSIGEIQVQGGDYNHQIYLMAEKGSNFWVQESSPWKGKITWHVFLIEPYARIEVRSRLLLHDEEAESIWYIHHEADFTESNISTRVVSEGTTKLIQDISLIVPEGRLQCKAHEQAHVLTMDPHAKVKIIPRLLVASDDTECSHGVSIRTIKDTDLFYLMSRGLNSVEAREMVIRGFLKV